MPLISPLKASLSNETELYRKEMVGLEQKHILKLYDEIFPYEYKCVYFVCRTLLSKLSEAKRTQISSSYIGSQKQEEG